MNTVLACESGYERHMVFDLVVDGFERQQQAWLGGGPVEIGRLLLGEEIDVVSSASDHMAGRVQEHLDSEDPFLATIRDPNSDFARQLAARDDVEIIMATRAERYAIKRDIKAGIVNSMIDTINNSKTEATWVRNGQIPGPEATITLPYDCKHIIAMNETRDDLKVITASLAVPKCLRQNGFGGRLMRSGFALALKYGSQLSNSHLSSPHSLSIRRAIFNDAITVSSPFAGVDLNVTLDEAHKLLRKESYDDGIIVESRLDELDIDELEMPVEHNSPDFKA